MNEWFCCLHMYVSRTTESRQKNELNEGMWYLLEALYNTFPNVCFSSWGCINSAMGTAGNGSQEGKINTVEPPQTDTSLQRPYFLVPADSPYIVFCLNLTTTVRATKACPQPAKLPLDNDQFFQQLMKESKIGKKFDLYGVLMMNCSCHYFDCVEFILCSKLSIKLKANVANLACFVLLTFWFKTLLD